MKYTTTILIMLLMFAPLTSFAKGGGFKVPSDAVIKVFSKEGKLLGTMSRKKYKVVRIGTSKVRVVEKTRYIKRKSKRTVGLLLGGTVGFNGLKTPRTNGSNYTVEEKRDAIGSLGVCTFKDNAGVCGLVGTDRSVGVQFHIPLGGK